MVFGIIGFGRFGKLWANSLSAFGKVLVYDKFKKINSANKKIVSAPLSSVCKTDMLFLLVPISQMENCCKDIVRFLSAHTLVIDACSVKVFPLRIMARYLSKNQQLMGTHPLFGPDSVRRSGKLTGHNVVVCPLRASKKNKTFLMKLYKKMGLKVIEATPKKHDRQMASSQSLVHFIGRGLAGLNLRPQKISTPDFAGLLNMNNMVVHDTRQLFLDMQKFNPFARKIRAKFLKKLIGIEETLSHAK